MAEKQITVYTCDLCGEECTRPTKDAPPTKTHWWVHLSIEDAMVDRSFISKLICRKCCEEIIKEFKENQEVSKKAAKQREELEERNLINQRFQNSGEAT